MKPISATLGAAILCTGMLLAQQTPRTTDTMPATTAESAGSSWTGLLIAASCDASSPTGSMPSMSRSTAMNTNQSYNSGTADRMSDVTTARKTTPVNESNTTYEQSVNQADRNRVATSAADTNGRGTPADMSARTSSASPDMSAQTTGTANDMHRASMGRSDMGSQTGDMNRRTSPNQTGMARSDMGSQTADMNRRTSPYQNSAGMSDTNTADRSMTAYNQSDSQGSGWAQAQQVASQMPDSCRISTTTSNFALRTPDGQIYRFDEASNNRIREQLNGRVAAHEMKIFRVFVRGNLQGETLSLDSIQL